jgi:corrinoid protein of di/trimethylamine methyltransferase
VVRDVHRKYLEAGADIIETNTFNAQRTSMSDYGLQAYCREINLAAARLARELADKYSTPGKPRYVAGSIGPTNRTTSVATSGQPLSKEALREAYEEQIKALAEGGVDALLIETIFDVENARIAMEAAQAVAPTLPLMLSFNVTTPDGHNMLGQNMLEFLQTLDVRPFAIGINCIADVAAMTPLIGQLARFGTRVSLYPNAGIPDSNGRYTKTPESLLHDLWPLLEGHRLNIVGGCCGTTDAHIRLIAQAVEPVAGIRLSPLNPSSSPTPAEDFALPKPVQTPQATVQNGADALFDAILNGKSDEAAAATKAAIAQGAQPQELINGQMIRAMGEVGQRFQDGKAFVPQLLMAGRAMKAALELLKPMLAGTASTSLGKVVIGTVKGDLHDIGKNLVASMLEGCGFEVVNIGIDVSADKFIEAVKQNQPDILCMSALLTTTMGYMKEVIDALEQAGIRQQVKVMVGGAPVTQGFADEIGADGYSDNANSAVNVAKQLLGKL